MKRRRVIVTWLEGSGEKCGGNWLSRLDTAQNGIFSILNRDDIIIGFHYVYYVFMIIY